MRKDEEVLEQNAINSPVKDLVTNGNIKAICLSAMEQQAIAFLDSIRDYEHESGNKICRDERTSLEFYQLFNNPTNGE